MIFENATKEDKKEILELYKSLIGTPGCVWTDIYPDEEEIDFDLRREALFCMRDDDGKIAGVISIDEDEAVEKLTCWSKELQPSGELARLGVRQDCQNQGIARELLKKGMEEMKKRGNKSVHFLVCKTNIKAIRSYEKLCFNTVGECEMFGSPYWCYEKAL